MPKLKPLSQDAVPAALEKAERYRFLNEPREAESICLDVLEIEPHNQQALITLLLARTDQFDEQLNPAFTEAREIIASLGDDYSKAYYAGIIDERRARAHLRQGVPGSGHLAYDWLRQAMETYEKAIEMRPARNDDAILRWNACARVLMNNPDVHPAPERTEPEMDD